MAVLRTDASKVSASRRLGSDAPVSCRAVVDAPASADAHRSARVACVRERREHGRPSTRSGGQKHRSAEHNSVIALSAFHHPSPAFSRLHREVSRRRTRRALSGDSVSGNCAREAENSSEYYLSEALASSAGGRWRAMIDGGRATVGSVGFFFKDDSAGRLLLPGGGVTPPIVDQRSALKR